MMNPMRFFPSPAGLPRAVACAAALAAGTAAGAAGPLVTNGGFEEAGHPARAWTQDVAQTGNKGAIAVDTARARSGRASLRMQPNAANAPPQLAVAQELSLLPYRGKTVELSVAMSAEGGARALAGLLVVSRSGPRMVQLEEVAPRDGWTIRTRTVDVPDESSARYFVALWVDGRSGSAWFDDVQVGAPGATQAAAPATPAAPAIPALAQVKAGGNYDPWNPPLGDPVDNLVLAEGWTDARLVASPVNVPGLGGWTDSVTATRDGRKLLFGYTKWDYFTFESSQRFVRKGVDRTASYSGDELQVYQADLGATGWTVRHHPVNQLSDLSVASMGLNDAEDLMVFNTYRFTPSYLTSMRMAALEGGAWSDQGELPAPINSPAHCLDDNGFIVGSLATGLTLYFESTRSDAEGTKCGKERHLHRARYANGAWSAVQALSGVNSGARGDSDMQPFASSDERTLYWLGSRPSQGKYGIYTAEWNGSAFANARMVIGIATFVPPWSGKVVRIGEPNVVQLPQGAVMYFMCGIAMGDTSKGAPDNIQYRVCFARKPNATAR